MKKILITGGAGFIGSNLANRLKKSNIVSIIDNFQTGKFDNLDLPVNIKCFDITETFNIQNLSFIPDEIYHLACAASPPAYQKNPIHTLETCFIGTKNILDFAKEFNCKVLFSSTSETYGDPLEHPQKESYTGNVTYYGSDRACYDEGKRVAETLCWEYQKLGVDVKIARIFNTFGPRMDRNDGRVVTNLINQALEDKPLTIYGDGMQTRSLCYVDDMIDGLISLMASDLKAPVNLGNDEEITMLHLACQIQYMIPESKSQIVFQDLPGNDPTQRKPDLSLAREKLNYNPKINWQHGLKKTIEWFKNDANQKI